MDLNKEGTGSEGRASSLKELCTRLPLGFLFTTLSHPNYSTPTYSHSKLWLASDTVNNLRRSNIRQVPTKLTVGNRYKCSVWLQSAFVREVISYYGAGIIVELDL